MHPKITTDPDDVVAGLAALPPPEPWSPTPDHLLRAILALDAVVAGDHPATSGPWAEHLAAVKMAELVHGPHRELLDAAVEFVRTLPESGTFTETDGRLFVDGQHVADVVESRVSHQPGDLPELPDDDHPGWDRLAWAVFEGEEDGR